MATIPPTLSGTISYTQQVAISSFPYDSLNNNEPHDAGKFLQLTDVGVTSVYRPPVFFSFTAPLNPQHVILDTDGTKYFIVWDNSGLSVSTVPLNITSTPLIDIRPIGQTPLTPRNVYTGVSLIPLNDGVNKTGIQVPVSGIYYLACEVSGTATYALWVNGNLLQSTDVATAETPAVGASYTHAPCDGYYYLNAEDLIGICAVDSSIAVNGSYLASAKIIGFVVQQC